MNSMILKNVRFPQRQIDAINIIAEKMGLSFSEVLRRIIDDYIEEYPDEMKKDLKRAE